MTRTILGLGTATMDVVLQCDSLPTADEFEIIRNEQVLSGGSCTNMLVTLVKLGVTAKQIAKIGDDSFGRIFKEDLLKDGIVGGKKNEKNSCVSHVPAALHSLCGWMWCQTGCGLNAKRSNNTGLNN